MPVEDERFPIGRMQREAPLTSGRRSELIDQIASLPSLLRGALLDVVGDSWDLRYRDDGWTVRQVVHHLADSHINAYVRFRLALTEDRPSIKPYQEQRWAELSDVRTTDPSISVKLLDALHHRWVDLLRALSEDVFTRELVHPEHQQPMSLDDMVVLYAWHGRHHVEHIRVALTRAARAPGGFDGRREP
jgi:hypothetical protein